MQKIALLVVPLLVVITGCESSPANHGGAFTGPCFYEPHSAIGPAAKLTLTDYGPPVTVGHISVADFDSSKARVAATRSTGPTISVGTGQSHTYLLAAPPTTTSCKLLDWAG